MQRFWGKYNFPHVSLPQDEPDGLARLRAESRRSLDEGGYSQFGDNIIANL